MSLTKNLEKKEYIPTSQSPRRNLTVNQLKARFEKLYGKVPTQNEFEQYRQNFHTEKE